MREIEIFINMVDSGTQVRGFQKTLGLSKSDIFAHMGRISFYRDIIRIAKQIRELLKDKANNLSEIKKLREELKQIFEGFKK